jgi:hypothetical protein
LLCPAVWEQIIEAVVPNTVRAVTACSLLISCLFIDFLNCALASSQCKAEGIC